MTTEKQGISPILWLIPVGIAGFVAYKVVSAKPKASSKHAPTGLAPGVQTIPANQTVNLRAERARPSHSWVRKDGAVVTSGYSETINSQTGQVQVRFTTPGTYEYKLYYHSPDPNNPGASPPPSVWQLVVS